MKDDLSPQSKCYSEEHLKLESRNIINTDAVWHFHFEHKSVLSPLHIDN